MPLIVIFCSNDFQSIFIKDELWDALIDRLFYFQFNRLKKKDVCGYIRFVNNLFTGDMKIADDKLEDIISRAPENINITFRELEKQCTIKKYDFEKVLKTITNIKEQKLKSFEFSSPKKTTSVSVFAESQISDKEFLTEVDKMIEDQKSSCGIVKKIKLIKKIFIYINDNFSIAKNHKLLVSTIYGKILEFSKQSPEMSQFYSEPRFKNLIEYMQKKVKMIKYYFSFPFIFFQIKLYNFTISFGVLEINKIAELIILNNFTLYFFNTSDKLLLISTSGCV